MGEHRDGERDDRDEKLGVETAKLWELRDDLGKDRGSLREPAAGVLIERNDRKPTGTANAVGERGETARDDDGRGLHLEDEPEERELAVASAVHFEAADPAHLPRVEGGVPDHAPLGEKDERPRVAARRKGFEHTFRREVQRALSTPLRRASGRRPRSRRRGSG